MSPAAARRLCQLRLRQGFGATGRYVCRGCYQHPARFRYRGEVRADRDHTLCFRCYRAERNRQRAHEFRLKAEATGLVRVHGA